MSRGQQWLRQIQWLERLDLRPHEQQGWVWNTLLDQPRLTALHMVQIARRLKTQQRTDHDI